MRSQASQSSRSRTPASPDAGSGEAHIYGYKALDFRSSLNNGGERSNDPCTLDIEHHCELVDSLEEARNFRFGRSLLIGRRFAIEPHHADLPASSAATAGPEIVRARSCAASLAMMCSISSPER